MDKRSPRWAVPPAVAENFSEFAKAPPPPPRVAHRHAEAFMVMRYESETGRHSELIWNSRDGITPFCVMPRGSSERAEMMRHVDFRGDRCRPFHVPPIGSRIFVNLTIDRARELRRGWYEKAKDSESWRPYLEGEDPAELIEKLAQGDFKSFGAGTSPDLIVVTEAISLTFARKAEAAEERRRIAERFERLDELRARKANIEEEIAAAEKELKIRPARGSSKIKIARGPVPEWITREGKGRRGR